MGMVFTISLCHAQQLSNYRKKSILIEGDTTFIDSLPIVPGSFLVKSDTTGSFYFLNNPSRIKWLKKPLFASVEVEYRVFPFSLNDKYRHLSFDSIFYRFGAAGNKVAENHFNAKPIDFGKLSTSGSLGRALSFGNRQDAVLNANLNLHISGYLADSIYVAAAISDNNLPIQPDGTTQNLNEIDKVSISFSKPNWNLQLGDFDLRQQQYFLGFYKRMQGIMYQTTQKLGHGSSNSLLLSGAVAKGKFTRNIFQGIEGNQGPYRLTGANAELFFIVLAGTERVFMDGVMLQRGEDQDYVINYNTAEIIFTPRQMITKDKRIQVEFEYADRNYLNSQMYMSNSLRLKKNFSINVGYYNNTDAKNLPINQSLNGTQKMYLSGLGDQVQHAFYNTAMEEPIAEGKILYRKVDTSIATAPVQNIYIYSNSSSEKLYSLSFYDKGPGQGNYILDTSLQLNGKVYKWVAPDPINGKKYGRYEPDVLLITPKSLQVYNVSTQWDLNAHTKLHSDIALSKYDINTLSQKDKSNDIGAGLKINLEHRHPLKKNDQLFMSTYADVEYASAQFKPIERLRSVEFLRDWGLDLIPVPANEQIVKGGVGLQSNEQTYFQYEATRYARNQTYGGFRHMFSQHMLQKNWILNNSLAYTTFSDLNVKGTFFRPTIDIGKVFPYLRHQSAGLKYSKESSIAHGLSTDSISLNSFLFETFQFYTNSDPTKDNKWSVKYFTRSDQLPNGKEMKTVDRSNNYNVQYEWMSHPSHQIRASAMYRTLMNSDSRMSNQKEHSLLGRLEYFAKYWKGAINGTSFYEVGSGQEPKKSFTYFEVPAGQGEYAWMDYNHDNIQQINEFEMAKFRDQAKYFKIFTPTNEYARANYLQFNYQFNIDPSIAIKSNAPFAAFIKRLYFQSNFQLNERKFATAGRSYNPFHSSVLDSSLVSSERLSSFAFSFNRYSQIWGIDMNMNRNAQLAFLSYGPESRNFNDFLLRARVNVKRTWTFDLTSRRNQTDLSTPTFANRNYHIKTISTEPRLMFTRSTSWRLAISMKADQKTNANLEHAAIHALVLDGKYNLVSNTAIQAKIIFSKIEFTGVTNSTTGYIMLDGLKPGNNGTWVVDVTKRLTKYVELNLMYEGRQSGGMSVVHLGRAQVRALL